MLEAVRHLGISPRLIETFVQDEHTYLVEDFIDGISLRLHVIRESSQLELVPAWRKLMLNLISLVEAAHGAGIVLGDFNPNNILIGPRGTVRFIDLELAGLSGGTGPVPGGGTLGYSAPEQLDGSCRSFAVDIFSLGATLLFITFGADPLFPGRPGEAHRSLVEWIEAAADLQPNKLPRTFADLLLAMLHPSSLKRPDLPHVRRVISNLSVFDGRARAKAGGRKGPRRLDSLIQQTIHGIGRDLITASAKDALPEPFRRSCAGRAAHPAGAYSGASGPLLVMSHLYASEPTSELARAIDTTSKWIIDTLRQEPLDLPGLFFGVSGPALALSEAGRALGSTDIASAGRSLAYGTALDGSVWDVTHGTAGAGLAWLAIDQLAPDEPLVNKAHDAALMLLASAGDAGSESHASLPDGLSEVDARSDYGYAHGAAGVGTFLLASGQRSADGGLVEAATAIGNWLLAAAVAGEHGTTWSRGPGQRHAQMLHWCHGSSGIGTYLVRLYKATGQVRFLSCAEKAAKAVAFNLPIMSNAYCHGLAGNADFLVDVFHATQNEEYLVSARRAVELLLARRCHFGDTVLPVDASGVAHTTDFGTGLAGILALLVRLRYATPRSWMPAHLS